MPKVKTISEDIFQNVLTDLYHNWQTMPSKRRHKLLNVLLKENGHMAAKDLHKIENLGTPLDRMILENVTCTKCGAKYGECSCWTN